MDLNREVQTLKALQSPPNTPLGQGAGKSVDDGACSKCGTNLHGKKECGWSNLSKTKAHKQAVAVMKQYAEEQAKADGDGEEG